MYWHICTKNIFADTPLYFIYQGDHLLQNRMFNIVPEWRHFVHLETTNCVSLSCEIVLCVKIGIIFEVMVKVENIKVAVRVRPFVSFSHSSNVSYNHGIMFIVYSTEHK